MAVISSPEQMPGQPPGLLLVGAQRQEVGQADVVVQGPAQPGGVDARTLDLLGDDQVVAEVVDAAPAMLVGRGHAEEAVGAGAGEQRPVDHAGPLPLVVVGRHLGGDEARDAVPEQLVLVVEEGALHGGRR